MIKNRLKRKLYSEKGAVAVELAIVLPLFAIFLLGTFELGAAAREHQVLENAAREGARFSALPPQEMSGGSSDATILATIRQRVIDYLQNEGITVAAGDIAVDQAYPVTIGSQTVAGSRVTVTYARPWTFAGTSGFLSLGSLSLQGDAVFRNFYAN